MALSDRFALFRDHLDNSRVNLQHFLWAKLFGYLIHPDIPTENKHLRVADIGCETGIWLTDLADCLPPSVRLDGFDLTLDAAPPAKWLPPNVTLQHWDVRTEPPREWIGMYDVVHIRMFSLIFNESQVRSVLKRLKRLLKPGGYLQWGDVDKTSRNIEKTNSSNPVNALTEIFKLYDRRGTGERWAWCSKLPSLLLEGGFEDVKADVRDAPPHLVMPFHESDLFDLYTLVHRWNGSTEEGARIMALIRQAERETSQGSVWTMTRWTVIGRKPLKDFGDEGSVNGADGGVSHPGGHLFFPY